MESLEYFHADDANPENDKYKVGSETINEDDIYDIYKDRVEIAKTNLSNMVKRGVLMKNTENDKFYKVYYNNELSRIIGKKICICSVVNKNNEIHPTILVKPMDLFKKV